MSPRSEQAFARRFSGQFIGCHQQGDIDDRIEDIHRRTEAVIGLQQTDPINIRGQRVCRFVGHRPVEQDDLLGAHGHDPADAHDQQDDNHRNQGRHRDMPDLPQPAGAVDFGRFIEVDVHIGQGGQVDDAAPAERRPDFAQDIDQAEGFGLRQQILRFDQADKAHDLGDDARGLDKELHNAADDHQGYEVRQIADGLDGLLVGVAFHFVQQQGKNDRCRELEDQQQDIEHHRVADRAHGEGAFKEPDKVVQTDPVALEKAQSRPVIHEGNDIADDRHITEDDEVDDSRYKKEIQGPVQVKVPFQTQATAMASISAQRTAFHIFHRFPHKFY